MINQLLKQLKFSDKETEVYLAVLAQGKVTPADVAKITNINRTTVYSIAQGLIKKGVIAQDLGGRTRYLVALPPKDLDKIVKKQEKQLKQKKAIINKAIKELAKLSQNTQYSIPKIVFITENDLENYLYKQSPIWNESILKSDKTATWWGFQDHSFVVHYEKWIDWYWQRAPAKLCVRLLSNKSEIEETMQKKKYLRREIKFWSKTNFTASTWVCGDYVIMVITKQRPHYLVEIHDVVLAHNMRELFCGIWDKV